jgi:hypothetical protein
MREKSRVSARQGPFEQGKLWAKGAGAEEKGSGRPKSKKNTPMPHCLKTRWEPYPPSFLRLRVPRMNGRSLGVHSSMRACPHQTTTTTRSSVCVPQHPLLPVRPIPPGPHTCHAFKAEESKKGSRPAIESPKTALNDGCGRMPAARWPTHSSCALLLRNSPATPSKDRQEQNEPGGQRGFSAAV